ncbi:universal stress protein [Actinosynnema sp. NPDC059797]
MNASNDEAVVAGVDGTGPSERAAMWAARQAVIFDKPLVLVYGMRWPVHAQAHLHAPVGMGAVDPALDEEPMRQWARDMLDGLAERCRDATGAEVRTEIASGDPADAMILAADRVAFVVVGHSDQGGVARFLLGSTAERLTRSCPWPVVVVRDEAAVDRRRDGGPVVVGVDGSPVSGRALRFAFGFATRHGAEVVVVHASSGAVTTTAVEPVGTREEAALREGWGPVGSELVECAGRYPGVRHRVVDAAGPPADALIAASAEAGLLVVGSHGKGVVRRAFLGSVSHEVVNSAPCPVAVLPPETEGTGDT